MIPKCSIEVSDLDDGAAMATTDIADATSSGGRLVFGGAGSPGVVYVPVPVELRGLRLDVLHILRAKPAMMHRELVFSV